MRATLRTTLGMTVLAATIPAQTTCSLVKDINTTVARLSGDPSGPPARAGYTSADEFVRSGNYWYFTATTALAGKELWKTDGSVAGTSMVKDINPGSSNSNPFRLTTCNGKLFFEATTAAGRELWISDGTTAGTVMVKDINPGTQGSFLDHFMCMGKKVYFSARTDKSGEELWCSDGTTAGTTLLKDIAPGTYGSRPRYLLTNPAGNAIYFQAGDPRHGTELWKSDGTSTGTVLLKDIHTGGGCFQPRAVCESPGGDVVPREKRTLEDRWYADGHGADRSCGV